MDTLDLPITTEQEAAQRVIAIIGVAPKQIKTPEQYEQGMLWTGQVVKRRRLIEGFFESLKKPLRQALDVVRNKEAKVLEPLVAEELRLKQHTGEWFMAEKRKADARQAELNRQHEEKVQQAVEQGKDPALVAAPKVVATPSTSIKSDGGPTMTMRLIKNWRVVKIPSYCQKYEAKIYRSEHEALKDIPDTAWVLDTARAMSIAKSGLSPSLEVYDVPSQAVSGV